MGGRLGGHFEATNIHTGGGNTRVSVKQIIVAVLAAASTRLIIMVVKTASTRLIIVVAAEAAVAYILSGVER